MAIPEDGIYEIVSTQDSKYIWDVDGASTSNNANIFIYSSHHDRGNNQRFILKRENDYVFLFAAHSLKVVDAADVTSPSQIKNLVNIIQWQYHGRDNQRWYLTDTTDSSNRPCYYIETAVNRNYVADNEGAYLKDTNNLIMYQKYTTGTAPHDNQKWRFERTTYLDSSMAVPSEIGIGLKADTESRNSYDITAIPQTIYPMWKCDGLSWQLRYRYRGRKVGETSYGDWNDWRSLSGLTTDDGWGNAWQTNCEADGTGVQKKATAGIQVSIDQVEYDRYEYEFAVRLFGYRVINDVTVAQSGNTASGVVTLNYMPTLTIDSFVLSGRGLVIGYTSDFKRGANEFTFDLLRGNGRRKLTVKESIFSDKDYTGTVLIPLSELAYIPENGENIMFNTTTKTIDTSRTQNFTRQIAYSSDHGLEIDAEFEYVEDGAYIEMTPEQEYEEMECHIIFEQDGEIIIADCEWFDGRFIILPPFNKDYTIMMSGRNGEKWGIRSWKGQRIESEGHLFNFEDEYFRLLLSEEPYNGPSVSYDADYEAYRFQGDRREAVYFNFGAEVTPTISGICPLDPSIPLVGKEYPKCCSLNDFHKLRLAQYAVYRDIYGRRYNVAIVGTDESPFNENLFNVSISMKERV